jgi:hypothetical protein
MAVSNVGRGISGKIADFSEGWAFNSEVSNGNRACGGKLAKIISFELLRWMY